MSGRRRWWYFGLGASTRGASANEDEGHEPQWEKWAKTIRRSDTFPTWDGFARFDVDPIDPLDYLETRPYPCPQIVRHCRNLSTGPVFEHTPFKRHGQQVRLLRLDLDPSVLPYDFTFPIPVQCTLATFDLGTCPEYSALSYVWGDPQDKIPLVIDGKLHEITTSLNDCLAYLRAERFEDWIWADAVCIDQENNEEKAEQIQCMRQIYQKACKVLAWLGQGYGSMKHDQHERVERLKALSSKLIAEALAEGVRHEIGQRNPTVLLGAKALSSQPSFCTEGATLDLDHFMVMLQDRPTFVQRLADIVLTNHKKNMVDNDLINVQGILSHPIWTRIWIIQEFSSARQVILLWEYQQIPLQQVFPIWAVLYAYVNGFKSDGINGNLVRSIAPMFLQSHVLWTTHQSRTLFELLRATSRYGASNPRDKVFALLGIAKDAKELGIHPDYAQPYHLHCRMVGRLLFLKYGPSMLSFGAALGFRDLYSLPGEELEFLRFRAGCCLRAIGGTTMISYPDTFHSLIDEVKPPSWSPDWTMPRHLTLVADQLPWHPEFCASSGATPGTLDFGEDGGTLKLPVLKVGPITQVQDPIRIADSNQDVKDVLRVFSKIQTMAEQARTLSSIYNAVDVSELEFGIPIAFQPYKSQQPRKISAQDGLVEGYRAIKDEEADRNRLNGRSWHWTEIADAIDRNRKADIYIQEVKRRCSWRRLFSCEAGYLGVGPPNVRDGDTVMLVPGARVPYIIRLNSGGNFGLVGEAFLWGIMYGEYVQERKTSVEIITFE